MADTDDISKHERSLLFVTEQTTHGTEDTPCRTEPCLPSPIILQPKCPSRTWTSKPLYTERDKNGAMTCTDNMYDLLINDNVFLVDANKKQNWPAPITTIGPNQDDIKVMEEEVSPGLNTFIQDVMLQSRCKESVERTTIISDVGQTMNAVLNELQTKHEMFKGSSILKVGSIYEDTKIDEPNEFDFLIELPALITVTEIKAFPIVGQVREREKGKRYLSLLCRDIFRDLIGGIQSLDDMNVLRSVWGCVRDEIGRIFNDNLCTGWRFLDLMTKRDSKHGSVAMTFTLLWDGVEYRNLLVNIDVCLAIPMELIEGYPNDDHQLVRPAPNKYRTHAIVRSNAGLRVTQVARERMEWEKDTDGKRKDVFRCLKYIFAHCTPAKYNRKSLRLEPLIPSYWIKTILFYLSIRYSAGEEWASVNSARRVLESLLLLEKCIEGAQLSSFFLAHNVMEKVLEEDRQLLLKELRSIIKRLKRMTLSTHELLQTLTKVTDRANDERLIAGLTASLQNMVLTYRSCNYRREDLDRIRVFGSAYLPGKVCICGTGRQLRIMYNEHVTPIAEET